MESIYLFFWQKITLYVVIQRFFQRLVVLIYVSMMILGLLFGLLRVRVPALWSLQFFAYQTMSPYQGYTTQTVDIHLEGGREDGSWETIPIEKYFPYGAGERTVRSKFSSFALQSFERRQEMMDEFAAKVLRLERKEGHAYTSVRLQIEKWNLSPEGYEAERILGKTEVLYIATAS